MKSDMEEIKKPAGGAPWVQPDIQQHIKWRDDDIVISVPPKSGTTWTMNIVHQILRGGSDDFQDIYSEVPWIEFLAYPGQPFQEVVDRVEAMPMDQPRAFKTHSAPPVVPFIQAGSDKHIKYIVVFRNPEEALVSFRPFLDQQTDEWRDLWQVPKGTMSRPDFSSFYYEVIDVQGTQSKFFGFLAAWWPLRHETNVLFLHYSDMKRDHEGTIRKIADFMGEQPTPEQWQAIFEYTSFDWMKQNEDRFEVRKLCEVPVLKSGAMVRRGQTGKAKSEGMTDEISRHLRQAGSQIFPDQQAINWYYEGGDLPA